MQVHVQIIPEEERAENTNMGVSGTTFFTIMLPPLESFPTPLMVAVAVIGVGLLVYFKKRKR